MENEAEKQAGEDKVVDPSSMTKETLEKSQGKPMNEDDAEKKAEEEERVAIDEAADGVAKVAIINDKNMKAEKKAEEDKVGKEDDREARIAARKTRAIEEVRKRDDEFIKLNWKVKVVAARLREAKEQLGYAKEEETLFKRAAAGAGGADSKVTQQKLKDVKNRIASWEQDVAKSEAEEKNAVSKSQVAAKRAQEARKEAATAAQEAALISPKQQQQEVKKNEDGRKRVAPPQRNVYPPPPPPPAVQRRPPPAVQRRPPPSPMNLTEFPPLK